MLLLVDQVKKRTQFLHNYLGQLQTSLYRKKYNEALNFIANQKSNINHTNVSRYNPNTFIIDSLKTKNQKLSQTLYQLNKQKVRLSIQIDNCKKKNGGIQNPIEIHDLLSFVSKIQFTLKDIRKLQLQPMNLSTNYQTLTIKMSQQKSYTISLNKIFFIDRKANLININCHIESPKTSISNESLYIAFKFQDQSTANVWFNVLTFGKVVAEAKGSRYLFLAKNNSQDIEALGISKYTINRKFQSEQSEFIGFGSNPLSSGGFKNNFMAQFVQSKLPMYASAINQKESTIPQNSFSQPQKQMIGSMINEPLKKPLNYSNFRPNPLNRVRGKTVLLDFNSKKNNFNFKNQNDEDYLNDQSNFFDSKSQHKLSKNNFRKASQDITLRQKNPTHQEKKLQKFRSQRNLVDEILSQSNQKPHKQSNHTLQSNSKRIDYQIERKNQILQRNNRNLDRSITNTFRPQDNIRWIKQKDEDMSISSKNSKNTNFRFKEQIQYTLEDPDKDNEVQSHQIQQAQETYQVSPTFPKKIVYQDGSNIRLYPVQNTHNRPKANSKTTSQYQSQQYEDIEPLRYTQQNQHYESQRIRNGRLNTLDSQTQKDHQIHESNSEDNEEEEFDQLLEELKKGLVLTKCAQGSFWTREKDIKLSENEIMLLIIDVKDKKIKKIGISDIVSVQYGKYGKGIIKHIQQIEEKKCLLLSVQEGKQIKKIQFVGNNPEKLITFATNLNYYVDFFKST